MSETLYVQEDDLTVTGIDPAYKEIYNYQGQPFTGFIRDYFDGQLPMFDLEYKNGYREGAYIEYFENPPGRKKEEYHEKYGLLNGDYKRWNLKGDLLYHALYEDDEEVELYLGSRNNYNY